MKTLLALLLLIPCLANSLPLMQSVDNIDYSYYPSSDPNFLNLSIPENFKYIDPKKLKYQMQKGEYRNYAIQYTGIEENFRRWDCKARLKEFRISIGDNQFFGDGGDFSKISICKGYIGPMSHLNFENSLKMMSEIILYHATERNVREPEYTVGVNHPQHAKYQMMARTGEYYATFKDLMPLTPEEHQIIRAYYDEVFMGNPFHTQQRKEQCDVNIPSRIASTKNKGTKEGDGQTGIGINGCGSYAINMVNAGLAYSISTNNNELFERAKMNLTHLLGSFDDEGIQVSQASRGSMAWGYHTDVTIQIGYTTEILASLGYDFLQHSMPRSGIKVKEVFDKHWDIVNDHTLMGKYAKYNKSVWEKYDYETVKNVNVIEMREIVDAGDKPWWHVALSNPRYLNEFRNETTTIWGLEVNLAEKANSRRGGAGNWYTQVFPSEYLYRINLERDINPSSKTQEDITGTEENLIKPEEYKLQLTWATVLDGEYVIEAEDILIYTIDSQENSQVSSIKDIEYQNMTTDSETHGREKLNIKLLENEMISIKGRIQIFPDEFIDLDILEEIKKEKVIIPFSKSDELVISWQ